MIKIISLTVLLFCLKLCCAQNDIDSLYKLHENAIKNYLYERYSRDSNTIVFSKRGSLRIVKPDYNVGGVKFNSAPHIIDEKILMPDTTTSTNICCLQETSLLDYYNFFSYPQTGDSISLFGLKDSLTYIYIRDFDDSWEHFFLDYLLSKRQNRYIVSYVDINYYKNPTTVLHKLLLIVCKFKKNNFIISKVTILQNRIVKR